MFKFPKFLIAAIAFTATGLAVAQMVEKHPGIGRAATPAEVKAWDIDVRPDFQGLPAGSGSVAKGQDVWEGKCAQCHGVFGESNEFFSPLIGGTTKEDVKTGRVAKLLDPTASRTTLMKVATVSTLWDYINRAMPWTQPKSLTTTEVYAVTAFLLNLGGVVPENFTLSDKNIAEVQTLMPNRHGMTTQHALWPGNEFKGMKKPDTQNVACMKDCGAAVKVQSALPDFARNAHGNLADQNRLVGAQHGAQTAPPEAKAVAGVQAAAAAPAGGSGKTSGATALALAQKNNCMVCHSVDKKLIGPSFSDIAQKHAGKADYLVGKIIAGGSGVWGAIPMPPQSLPEAEAKAIAAWLATGAVQ